MTLEPKYIFHSIGTGRCGYFTVPGFAKGTSDLIHAFSTRPEQSGNGSPDAIEAAAGIQPLFKSIPPHFLTNILMTLRGEKCMIRTAQQVHGSAILYLWQKPTRFETPVEADGLATDQEGLILGITTADCLPILLVDPKVPCVAAVHAGWRGTVKQIAMNAVECMVKQGQAERERIRAVLGPSVRTCCYTVGGQVAAEMKAALPERAEQVIANGNRLDLAAANRIMLESAGIPPKNIFHLDLCTRCNKDLFHSYRRDGKEAGRQVAIIGIRSQP